MGIIAPQEMELFSDQNPASQQTAHRMRLCYGLSENNLWTECKSAHDVSQRVQQAAAQIVRLSVNDDWHHSGSWQQLENYLTGVLAAGAVPMITFSKFGQPYDDAGAIRWFARSATGLVRQSIDRWGPEVVREWFWCLGDQPNSNWLNAGLTFDLYRDIYEAASESVTECLAPYLDGQKALVGGPGIDGFQPFWMDWVYRFVNEIENRLISFVVWHRYGEWRQPGDWGAPKDERVFRALLMSRAAEYEIRARAVGRMLKGRAIRNVCGELNAHSDHYSEVSGSLNQTEFGAAFYGSTLIHLMRGGLDVEMLRSVTPGGTPQHIVKQLCARFIRADDYLDFSQLRKVPRCAQIVLATGADRELTAFLVHCGDELFTLSLRDIPMLEPCRYSYKIDTATNGTIVEGRFNGELRLNGLGVAVLASPEATSQ
jgi:hypothetical protein